MAARPVGLPRGCGSKGKTGLTMGTRKLVTSSLFSFLSSLLWPWVDSPPLTDWRPIEQPLAETEPTPKSSLSRDAPASRPPSTSSNFSSSLSHSTSSFSPRPSTPTFAPDWTSVLQRHEAQQRLHRRREEQRRCWQAEDQYHCLIEALRRHSDTWGNWARLAATCGYQDLSLLYRDYSADLLDALRSEEESNQWSALEKSRDDRARELHWIQWLRDEQTRREQIPPPQEPTLLWW